MKKIVLTLFLLLTIATPIMTKADGGLMPPHGYWIAESDQKGIIVFENNFETLVLSTTFRGNANEFSWIIPTPSKPEVDKGTYGIFEALDELTNVYSGGFDYGMRLGVTSMQESAPAVNIIEQKKVDMYDISVLEANDKDALYNWLKDNGYNYPEYGKTVLDDYIRNSWYFTAIKIIPENTQQAEKLLKSGTITPIKLVFPTDKIVYPLKISSITMNNPEEIVPMAVEGSAGEALTIAPIPPIPNNYVSIKLYVFADHKKEINGFTTAYANWVKSKEIKDLAKDDNGNNWYSPKGNKMYLTVLSDSMNTSDMRNDIFPNNAKDNDTIPPSQFWMNFFLTIFFIIIIILSPFGLLYIIFMLLFMFIKSRPAKIVFLLLQGLLILTGIIISLITIFSYTQSYYGTEDIIPLIISTSGLTLVMIVGMILEIVKGKRKGIL